MVRKITVEDTLDMPPEDRFRLAQDIWDSIAEHPESVPVTEQERQEIDRRLRSFERNVTATIPWDEVKRRLLSEKR